MPEVNPIQTSSLPLKVKLLIELWAVVEVTLFRCSPRTCRGYRCLLLRLFGAKVSSKASVHNTARIYCPWNLEMDDYASLGEHSWAYSLAKIHIGRYSCVGPRVLLLTGSHDYQDPTFPLTTRRIDIGAGCWLAAGVMILPGVRIGDGAVVGAGSVVTKGVEAWTVVGGNPARFIKRRVLKTSSRTG